MGWNTTAAMQVFCYIDGTMNCGVSFLNTTNPLLWVFFDADWGNCPNTRQSHNGFLVLRSNHLLLWKSKKQPTVSLLSNEAEYKALANACKDTIWLKNLCSEIFLSKDTPGVSIFVNNPGDIDLALSQVSQNSFRMKHMVLCLHFIRDLVSQQAISI